MTSTSSNNFKQIYELWHEYAATRQVDELAKLYAEDATFESPLVPILSNQQSGVLTGIAQVSFSRCWLFLLAWKNYQTLI